MAKVKKDTTKLTEDEKEAVEVIEKEEEVVEVKTETKKAPGAVQDKYRGINGSADERV